jgi:hypothetical protein
MFNSAVEDTLEEVPTEGGHVSGAGEGASSKGLESVNICWLPRANFVVCSIGTVCDGLSAYTNDKLAFHARLREACTCLTPLA